MFPFNGNTTCFGQERSERVVKHYTFTQVITEKPSHEGLAGWATSIIIDKVRHFTISLTRQNSADICRGLHIARH